MAPRLERKAAKKGDDSQNRPSRVPIKRFPANDKDNGNELNANGNRGNALGIVNGKSNGNGNGKGNNGNGNGNGGSNKATPINDQPLITPTPRPKDDETVTFPGSGGDIGQIPGEDMDDDDDRDDDDSIPGGLPSSGDDNGGGKEPSIPTDESSGGGNSGGSTGGDVSEGEPIQGGIPVFPTTKPTPTKTVQSWPYQGSFQTAGGVEYPASQPTDEDLEIVGNNRPISDNNGVGDPQQQQDSKYTKTNPPNYSKITGFPTNTSGSGDGSGNSGEDDGGDSVGTGNPLRTTPLILGILLAVGLICVAVVAFFARKSWKKRKMRKRGSKMSGNEGGDGGDGGNNENPEMVQSSNGSVAAGTFGGSTAGGYESEKAALASGLGATVVPLDKKPVDHPLAAGGDNYVADGMQMHGGDLGTVTMVPGGPLGFVAVRDDDGLGDGLVSDGFAGDNLVADGFSPSNGFPGAGYVPDGFSGAGFVADGFQYSSSASDRPPSYDTHNPFEEEDLGITPVTSLHSMHSTGPSFSSVSSRDFDSVLCHDDGRFTISSQGSDLRRQSRSTISEDPFADSASEGLRNTDSPTNRSFSFVASDYSVRSNRSNG